MLSGTMENLKKYQTLISQYFSDDPAKRDFYLNSKQDKSYVLRCIATFEFSIDQLDIAEKFVTLSAKFDKKQAGMAYAELAYTFTRDVENNQDIKNQERLKQAKRLINLASDNYPDSQPGHVVYDTDQIIKRIDEEQLVIKSELKPGKL